MRLPRFKVIGTLIVAGVAFCVLLAGCTDIRVAAGGTAGCRQGIRGVTGVIRTETSRLSCADIDKLIIGLPSKPETYLLEGETRGVVWKCRFNGVEEPTPVILRCEHDKRRFSIVKNGS